MNIWESMKKWAQDLRLKRKMMIVFCALLSLSLAVVLAASFLYFSNMMRNCMKTLPRF